MFIATSAQPMISLRWERNPAAEPSPRRAKAIALLRSFGVKREPPGYRHLAPLGRSDEQLVDHAGRIIFNDLWPDSFRKIG
jgi:hypothetical protein